MDAQRFVVAVGGDGRSVCRIATQSEAVSIQPAKWPVVSVVRGDATVEDIGGLKIVVRGTDRFRDNPAAVAAFQRAAAQLERRIRNKVTIYFDVDLGDSQFGFPWGGSVLASSLSGSSWLLPVGTITSALIAGADDPSETALYAAMPATELPTDRGPATTALVTGSELRALGLLPAAAAESDLAPSIAFNSAYTFDYDSSDGIDLGAYDFEGIAVHEIAHALGFQSSVGYSANVPAPLDFFRFDSPIVTMATFTTSARRQVTGGSHAYFAGARRTEFSSGLAGDGRQASHWKDDALRSGQGRIGIMDPTLGPGQRQIITDADMEALDVIGWDIQAKGLPVAIDRTSSAAVTCQVSCQTAR